jgi:hypothetical protein
MNPLQIRLATLRRRLRLVASVRGMCWLVAFVLGCAVLAGALDWLLHLPALLRALLLLGTVGGALVLAYQYLYLPLCTRNDDLSLALRVEAHYPVLNDALASTVQFLQQPDSEWAGSPSLRREAVQQAMRLAQGCDFTKVVNKRGLLSGGLAFLAGSGFVLFMFLWDPALAWTTFDRLANPFGGQDWPTQTRLEVVYDRLIPAGQPFTISGTVSGEVPKTVTIECEDLIGFEEPQDIAVDAKANNTFTATFDLTRQQGDFRFRVHAGDAVSPAKHGAWHEVTVRQPPEVTSLQVRLEYPKYTGLKPEELPGGLDAIEEPLVLGTRLIFRGNTDRPIARAWIQYQPEDPRVLLLAEAIPLAGSRPLDALGFAAAAWGVWQPVPARLDKSGTAFSAVLMPRLTGRYHLVWVDDIGVGQRRTFTLRVKPDPAPDVKLECLSLVHGSTAVSPKAVLTLKVVVTDPEYGMKSLFLEYRRKDREGRDLDADWRRVSLFDAEEVRAAAAGLLRPIQAGLRMRLSVSALPFSPRRLEYVQRWPIQGLVQEGQTLVLRAAADDYDDVSPLKEPGRSTPPLELLVISTEELKTVINNAMRQVRDDLTALNVKQEKALKMVTAAEQQLKNTRELRPEDVKQLLEAREEQKKLQDRIGKDTSEMLQKDVDRIRRALEDNQLPRSSANDKMDNVARALKRLAGDRLNRIQERIEKALRDQEEARDLEQEKEKLEGREREADKEADPAKKRQLKAQLKAERQKLEEKQRRPLAERNNDLKQTRQDQEEVQKTLEGLLTDLVPFVTGQEMQDRAKALLREERELEQETQKLGRQEREVDREWDQVKKRQQKAQLKAEREKQAERQRRLAERTRQLLNDMRDVAQERSESNPEMARKLNRAAEEGMKNQVADQMKQAEEDLRQGRMNEAARNQRGSARTLEKVAAAMEERREEELDRLSKKQQAEHERLEDLKEKMDKLRKKVQEAKKTQKGEQLQATLRKLADEQKKIQEEVDQMVRRLSRMQADEAVQELRRASRRMDEAGQRMDDGEDPEKQQKDALDRMNEAEKQLQKANNRVENELAREKLAKIADFIKRLKTRQDAAIEESVRIQKELLRAGQWERGLIGSLSKLKLDRQKGLATETAALEKKLEGATVFAYILHKAAVAMKKATDRMQDRQDTALERVGRPLTKDELAEEKKADAETVQYQREAARRLQRLLDALKQETGGVRPPQEDQPKQDPPEGGDQDAPPPANQDGIPTLAEQKALRAEQQEVNERTRAFDERHPELDKLSDEEKLKKLDRKERAELQEIHDDQKKVHQLAEALFKAAKKERE